MQTNSHLGRSMARFSLKQSQKLYRSSKWFKMKSCPQSDRKVTPKVTPQRRPNGLPKATNGAQWRPRGAPMDPQRWQMEPQWPSKGSQGSPRVPKDHRRQAKRAQWNLKLNKLRSSTKNKQQTTHNKQQKPQPLILAHWANTCAPSMCLLYYSEPRLHRPSACQHHMCVYVHPNIYFCFSICMCVLYCPTQWKNRDSGPL